MKQVSCCVVYLFTSCLLACCGLRPLAIPFTRIYILNDWLPSMYFLIPWTGGAFAPTTEEKKWPIAPKPGPYDLY